MKSHYSKKHHIITVMAAKIQAIHKTFTPSFSSLFVVFFFFRCFFLSHLYHTDTINVYIYILIILLAYIISKVSWR